MGLQLFNRDAVRPPPYLVSARMREARTKYLAYFELQARQREQTRPPPPAPLEHESVQVHLSRLFASKCAFCEGSVPTAVHRFRPPSDAAPLESRREGHLYYGWLSEAWENLYPICADCRPENPSVFPVRQKRAALPLLDEVRRYVASGEGRWTFGVAESALLLDPCRAHSLAADLRFNFDGRIVGGTEAGRRTIVHFHLDRANLTQRRAAAFRDYFNGLLGAIEQAGAPLPMLDFPQLEFGGGWWLLLRTVVAPLSSRGLASLGKPAALRRLIEELQGTSLAAVRLLELRNQAERREVEAPRPPPRLGSVRRGDVELRSVTVRDFKGLERLTLNLPDLPADRTAWDDVWRPETAALLLLGENATGKSSLLEAVALALCEPGVLQALDLDRGDFLLDAAQLGEGRRAVAREARVTLGFDDGSDHTMSLTRARIALEDHERLPPVFAYGAFRQFGSSPEASQAHFVATLFDSSALLPNPEAWLANLNEGDFIMVVRELRFILSIEGTYDVIERSDGPCVMVTGTRRSDGSELKRRTPLSAVSSGYRSVLGMACDIMRSLMEQPDFKSFQAARGVVLIDEIEAHLHPRWKLQVIRGLRRVFPLMTFIVTSHDPLCLRGMEPGEVAVLTRTAVSQAPGASSTRVEVLTALPDIGQLTVDQLLTSDLFNLFSADAPSTERAFARVADSLARRRDHRPPEPGDDMILDQFEREIAAALPVGATDIQRLVQDAVAGYLRQREEKVGEQLRTLREETRREIIDALDGLE